MYISSAALSSLQMTDAAFIVTNHASDNETIQNVNIIDSDFGLISKITNRVVTTKLVERVLEHLTRAWQKERIEWLYGFSIGSKD